MSWQLFGAPTGNCFRAAIALEEVGFEFAVRPLDLAKGEHKEPWFLALNPAGKVPVLVGEDTRGRHVLTQSNAIMMFADMQKEGVLLPVARTARTLALERYFYVVTEAIAANGAAFALERRGDIEAAATLYEQSAVAIAAMERFAEQAPYLGGDSYSLADIAGFVITRHGPE